MTHPRDDDRIPDDRIPTGGSPNPPGGDPLERVPAQLIERHRGLLGELAPAKLSDEASAVLFDAILESAVDETARSQDLLESTLGRPVRLPMTAGGIESELEALDESVLGEVRERLRAVRVEAESQAADALGQRDGDGLVSKRIDPEAQNEALDELVPATAGRGSGLLRALGRQDGLAEGETPSRIWDTLRSEISRDRATRRRVRRIHQWSWRLGTAAVVVIGVFIGGLWGEVGSDDLEQRSSTDSARAKVRFVESETPLFGYRSGASIVEEVRGD